MTSFPVLKVPVDLCPFYPSALEKRRGIAITSAVCMSVCMYVCLYVVFFSFFAIEVAVLNGLSPNLVYRLVGGGRRGRQLDFTKFPYLPPL